MRRLWTWGIVAFAVVTASLVLIWQRPRVSPQFAPLKVAMSPYQDLAMIVNIGPLKLEQKYGTKVQLMTMGWEDIPPAVASAGSAADIGFGSYIEYLTKYEKLNAGSDDPVLFIHPLYVFKGGAFVTFNTAIPTLSRQDLAASAGADAKVKSVLAARIGAQKASVYEMMIYDLALRTKLAPGSLKITDTPLDQGFLAAERGDLDLAEAGLTQITEAQRRGGRVVFTMEEAGFADITGFIVKKSVYERRQRDIDNLIRMWFDCVRFVYQDIDHNSAASLAYLNRNASTRYTLAEYRSALGQEYLPPSLPVAHEAFIGISARYSAARIGAVVNRYLVDNRRVGKAAPLPVFAAVND
jgi:hypothetical protein